MTTQEWPTEQDLENIRRAWRSQGGSSGPYASYRTCATCSEQRYCFGKVYDSQVCWDCFVESKRPKRKRRG